MMARKLLVFFLPILIFTNCVKQEKKEVLLQDKNELLLQAYKNNNYARCLEILIQEGADGRIDYLTKDTPLLFDICQKYLDNNERSREIEPLFNFYLKYRKEAFEDSIRGIYPKKNGLVLPGSRQTVGSYLARYATVELLRKIVQNKININSPNEKPDEYGFHALFYHLAFMDMNYERSKHNGFHDWIVLPEEKKIRMELLLDAGADVTYVNSISYMTIFHFFSWYPFEEDYTGLLDRIIEKGANLFGESRNGDSCIQTSVGVYALGQNTEAYLKYLISRGLYPTKDDLLYFLSTWYRDMVDDKTPETDRQRLKKILRILEENLKVTVVLKPVGGWNIIE